MGGAIFVFRFYMIFHMESEVLFHISAGVGDDERRSGMCGD